MTDKEKLEKLVSILMKRLYMHKTKADIGSTEKELFDEKIENAQYEECKNILNIIDSMQKECKPKYFNVEKGELSIIDKEVKL